MKKHIEYLIYVFKHKYFVFLAGRKLGLGWWQLLIHDWSKFRPSEWTPYVEHFYGAGKNQEEFDRAWNHHQNRNKHHWQYWVLQKDKGTTRYLEIPTKYAKEMVADWAGAGRAITGDWNVALWYEEQKTKERIQLNSATRLYIETLIEQFNIEQ